MATWHDIESIRSAWDDAEQIEDDILGELLAVAREAVIAYAPKLSAGTTAIPTRYRVGQAAQVKNLWNATQAGPNGSIGDDTFAIQPRPLDWHVKQILRPARGRPRVG